MFHIDTWANKHVQLAENVFHHGSALPVLFRNDVAVAHAVRPESVIRAIKLLDTCRCCPVHAAE